MPTSLMSSSLGRPLPPVSESRTRVMSATVQWVAADIGRASVDGGRRLRSSVNVSSILCLLESFMRLTAAGVGKRFGSEATFISKI